MYTNTIDISDSPTLSNLYRHLESHKRDDRLGIVLSFLADHCLEWSVSYLQPNWRKRETLETALVTLLDEGDTLALPLTDDSLESDVELIGETLGY
jgi:hypothetical protein